MEAEPKVEAPKSDIDEQVRLMFRQGKYAETVPVIREHLSANPDDVPAYELMADALKYSGDKSGAAGALATAAELYAAQGQVIQSISAQKKMIKLGVEPDYSIARAARAGGAKRVVTPLFDDLSDAEFHEVVDRLDHHVYETGETVVEEGQAGDSMFVVASGSLEVLARRGASEVRLAELVPGDFFGEAALLSGRPRTATIRALAPSDCLVLSRSALESLVATHPRVKEVMAEFNRQRAEATIEALIRRKGH